MFCHDDATWSSENTGAKISDNRDRQVEKKITYKLMASPTRQTSQVYTIHSFFSWAVETIIIVRNKMTKENTRLKPNIRTRKMYTSQQQKYSFQKSRPTK